MAYERSSVQKKKQKGAEYHHKVIKMKAVGEAEEKHELRLRVTARICDVVYSIWAGK